MSVGPVVIAVGLALLTRIGYSGNYLTEVLPAVVIFGLGLAINVAPLTFTVLTAVPASHAGTTYLHAARFSAGFGTASLISAGLCLAGGALAAVTIRNRSF